MANVTITADIGPGLSTSAQVFNNIYGLEFDFNNETVIVKKYPPEDQSIFQLSNINTVSFSGSNGDFNITITKV